jgi:hypothetical protein
LSKPSSLKAKVDIVALLQMRGNQRHSKTPAIQLREVLNKRTGRRVRGSEAGCRNRVSIGFTFHILFPWPLTRQQLSQRRRLHLLEIGLAQKDISDYCPSTALLPMSRAFKDAFLPTCSRGWRHWLLEMFASLWERGGVGWRSPLVLAPDWPRAAPDVGTLSTVFL